MLFKILNGELSRIPTETTFKELEVEKLIAGSLSGPREIDDQIFKEPLMYLGRQRVMSSNGKQFGSHSRLDMICIDGMGRGVVVELKRERGQLGMETQALFYLSRIAHLEGINFLEFGLGRIPNAEDIESVEQFCCCKIDKLNMKSRIILLAQRFDRAIFSLGTWFSQNDCAFKAVSYSAMTIGSQQFLNFSTDFEIHPEDSFGLKSLKGSSEGFILNRKPAIFWQNIGIPERKWWEHLIQSKKITASYDNSDRSDSRGSVIMNQYIEGDTVIAFATGYGAVGFGVIGRDSKYRYLPHNLSEYADSHYHARDIVWKSTLPLDRAVSVSDFSRLFHVNHPSQTKQEIRDESANANGLILEIQKRAANDASESA